MADYLFIYRGEAGPHKPDAASEMTQRWIKWIVSIGEQGHLKDRGQPLENSGRVVAGNSIVTDGPYAETKDLISGFTIVKADDLDQAVALTKGCPIFEVGGLVEVRPLINLGA